MLAAIFSIKCSTCQTLASASCESANTVTFCNIRSFPRGVYVASSDTVEISLSYERGYIVDVTVATVTIHGSTDSDTFETEEFCGHCCEGGLEERGNAADDGFGHADDSRLMGSLYNMSVLLGPAGFRKEEFFPTWETKSAQYGPGLMENIDSEEHGDDFTLFR